MIKSISVTQPISRAFCLAVDLQRCKLIYSFVDTSVHIYFIRYQDYVSLYLDECLETVPCYSQELYFAKW